MKKQGEQHAGVPALLTGLAAGRSTGVLELEADDGRARIGLRDGTIVGADHGEGQDAQLQAYLYRMGLIDGIKHGVISRMRAEYGLSFEEAVVKSSVCDVSRLASAVAFKIAEVLTDSLTWDRVVHRFLNGAALYAGSRVSVALDAAGLSRELRSRLEEWRRAEAFLGRGPVRVRVLSSPGHPLERDQVVICRLANGGATMRELVAGSGLGRYRTYRAVHRLALAGLVAVSDGGAAPGAG